MADDKDGDVLPVNVKIELAMIVFENCPGTLRTGSRGSTFTLEGKDLKKNLLLGLLSMNEKLMSDTFSPEDLVELRKVVALFNARLF